MAQRGTLDGCVARHLDLAKLRCDHNGVGWYEPLLEWYKMLIELHSVGIVSKPKTFDLLSFGAPIAFTGRYMVSVSIAAFGTHLPTDFLECATASPLHVPQLLDMVRAPLCWRLR